jgi:hypothetical protein
MVGAVANRELNVALPTLALQESDVALFAAAGLADSRAPSPTTITAAPRRAFTDLIRVIS